MHPNQAFRQAKTAQNQDFARERGFGTLAVCGGTVPLLAHIPFLLNQTGTMAELHLVRSNPIAQLATGPIPGVIHVAGPDSYVSPDWYDLADQVPTWNYVSVHLRGVLNPLPPDALRPMLDRLSAHFETRLLPKDPWVSAKMSAGVMDRMMRAILPFSFTVEETDGTWKLNQNKPQQARSAAANHVGTSGIGSEVALLSALMHGVGGES